jgi:hypothetical protein
MSKSIDTAASVTVSTDGTLTAEEFWVQSTGLIDCSAKHGMNVELKATFADNAAVAGDLTFYIVRANDGGTDITSAANAVPISVMTPVQNTTVKDVVTIPLEFDDDVGFAVQNADESYSVTNVSISYRTVTL